MNTSALNRPFDDLGFLRIRREAEAVALLVASFEAEQIQLISSEYLAFEASQDPDRERVLRVLSVLRLATTSVKLSEAVARRARELERFGLRGLDALHVASAEAGRADLLVTTDDRLARRARRAGDAITVQVASPIEALAALVREEAR